MGNEVNSNPSYIDEISINGIKYTIRDKSTQQALSALIETTLENNNEISEHINDLNDRLEVIEQIEHDKDKTPLITVANIGSTITIDPYALYDFGTVNKKVTVSFAISKEEPGYCAQYAIKFVAQEGCEIVLPSTVIYENGNIPMFVVGRTYEFYINNNIVSVGEFYSIGGTNVSQIEQNLQTLLNAQLITRMSQLENEVELLTWEINDLKGQTTLFDKWIHSYNTTITEPITNNDIIGNTINDSGIIEWINDNCNNEWNIYTGTNNNDATGDTSSNKSTLLSTLNAIKTEHITNAMHNSYFNVICDSVNYDHLIIMLDYTSHNIYFNEYNDI